MSDIKQQNGDARAPRAGVGDAASGVLVRLERHIRGRRLGVGDALPTELELAGKLGVGRSSVREALTALKVLGIIQSRRKGGIRIVRDPVLLELRHYFAPRLASRTLHAAAAEFRAALEWGLGPFMLARADGRTVRRLRAEIDAVARGPQEWAFICAAEIRFHTILTASCGNRLASLFAHLYEPIFELPPRKAATASDVREWIRRHASIVDALAARHETRFLRALRDHTRMYVRPQGGVNAPSGARRRRQRENDSENRT